jgi:hypothetical protein
MSLNTLTGGAFSDMQGIPLASGYLTLELSHDEVDTGSNSQIVGGLIKTIPLDNNGNIAGSPAIENNDTMNPAGSFYIVNAYRSDGTKAWRAAQYLTVVSTSNPFNVGTGLTPSNPPGPGTGGSGTVGSILLQVNSVNAGSQSKLNAVAGSNMTITDNGSGNWTFASTSATTLPRLSLGSWHLCNLGAGNLTATTNLSSYIGTVADFLNNAGQTPTYTWVAPTATLPAFFRVQTNVTTGLGTSGYYNGAQNTGFCTAQLVTLQHRVMVDANTSVRYWIGALDASQPTPIGSNTLKTDTPSVSFIGFRFSTNASDAHWMAIANNAGVQTATDTGVSVDTTAPHLFEVRSSSSGATLTYYIDGVLKATITTNVPSNTALLRLIGTVDNISGQPSIYLNSTYWETNP